MYTVGEREDSTKVGERATVLSHIPASTRDERLHTTSDRYTLALACAVGVAALLPTQAGPSTSVHCIAVSFCLSAPQLALPPAPNGGHLTCMPPTCR